MKDKNLKWSLPYLVFDAKHHLDVRGKPGIYRIRAFTEDGEPLPISRAVGVDPLGVLHIGKSNDLGRRLKLFRRAVEGAQASHHAGREYAKWHFERLVPRERLWFDYVLTADGAARDAERAEYLPCSRRKLVVALCRRSKRRSPAWSGSPCRRRTS